MPVPKSPKSPKSRKSGVMQNLALLSHVGYMMLFPILGLVLLGGFLDRKLGTGGIITIVCAVIGAGAAFRNLYVFSITKSREYAQYADDATDTERARDVERPRNGADSSEASSEASDDPVREADRRERH